MEYVGLFNNKRLYFKEGERKINITLPDSVLEKLEDLDSIKKSVALDSDTAGFVRTVARMYEKSDKKEILSAIIVDAVKNAINNSQSQEQSQEQSQQVSSQKAQAQMERQKEDKTKNDKDKEGIRIKELKETPKGRFFLMITSDGRKFYIDSSGLSEKFWNHLKETNFKNYVLLDCEFRKVKPSKEGQSPTYFLSSCKIRNTETGKEYSYTEKTKKVEKTEKKQEKKRSATENSENSDEERVKKSYFLKRRNS